MIAMRGRERLEAEARQRQEVGGKEFHRGRRKGMVKGVADLDKRENREDWIKWAIEFVSRGIEPEDVITVHGPHSPADYMWGEMGPYEFRTASGIRGIHDVRGVRVINTYSRQPCPLIPKSELSPKERRWLRTARRTLARRRSERTTLR